MKKTLLFVCPMLLYAPVNAQELGIINNSKSPYVQLKSIDFDDCKWTRSSMLSAKCKGKTVYLHIQIGHGNKKFPLVNCK